MPEFNGSHHLDYWIFLGMLCRQQRGILELDFRGPRLAEVQSRLKLQAGVSGAATLRFATSGDMLG
jgi:hypothetical protein